MQIGDSLVVFLFHGFIKNKKHKPGANVFIKVFAKMINIFSSFDGRKLKSCRSDRAEY